MAAISLSLDDIATIVSFLKDVWDVCNDVNSSYSDFTTLMGDARNMSACKSLQDALATDGSTLQTLGIDQDMADNIKTVAVNSDEYVEGLLRTLTRYDLTRVEGSGSRKRLMQLWCRLRWALSSERKRTADRRLEMLTKAANVNGITNVLVLRGLLKLLDR